MKTSMLKRLLWVMNEILEATPNGGITRNELSDKWEISCKNDEPGSPIPERTFYRIRKDIHDLFGCELECISANKKYVVKFEDDDYSDHQTSLLNILMKKSEGTSIYGILQLIVSGNDVPANDMRAARDLAAAVSRLPQKYADNFFKEAEKIEGADKWDWDKHYRNYICVWNEETYNRTSQWLSIGFYDNDVYIYVVTDEQDPAERDRKAKEELLDEGVKYRGGYYWHEPEDKELFRLSFDTKPDMEEVKKRAQLLLSRIANL